MAESPAMTFFLSCSIKLWCAHVTVIPEAKRTAVFSKGIEKGLMALIPVGGQTQPNSVVGESLLWKKAQKKAKKNITSETMKRIIPHRRPVVTKEVWNPIIVPSRIMSRHH